MIQNIIKPRIALNKAFLKLKPTRSNIEKFKTNLIRLTDQINEAETEEFHKNIISGFFRETYFGTNFYINTKGRNDLVFHNGKNAKSTVGVILEVKKPNNKSEMLSLDNLNTKAFQELLLYYLRERLTVKNSEIRYLIVTNIYEWFIFDAQLFERLFAGNKSLIKRFTDFENKRLSGIRTDFFYKEIAEPLIDEINMEISFTYFDIRDYSKLLRNTDKQEDNKLIVLYKLLSPEHLLKLPFLNDSNTLDKTFYSELLHILGLTEIKEGSNKLISRKKEGERHSASFIENAIIQIENLDKISRIERVFTYGETKQEQLFNLSLELSITWINRILFLKLLESQLIKYHKGNKSFSFLNIEKIQSFDDLNSLFFSVLARKPDDRNEDLKKMFANVPYLNSSLFEPAEIEHSCLFISQLSNKKLPVINTTILKDQAGKKYTGEMNILEYLFEFLNAYDFAGEGSEEIQEDNKTLINASVLELIFEKINGYKDGSFFTPGIITMYMCRETIRRAVVQKFNDTKEWNCKDMDSLFDKIEDKKEANQIIDSLKICDPAVGSGHFLVSALNEIITIKSDLKILLDRQGKTLRDYQIEVVNDELIVTDDDGRFFEYNPQNMESLRVQEALFHEKQTIIENCLFGVDINPNSVKICRLRLWIELLKNAYYRIDNGTDMTCHIPTMQLETLPNIDINIKCGNSLISRYAIEADLKQSLRNSKWTIDSYRLAIMTYRNARSKDEKRAMEDLILKIKQDFTSEIRHNDPRKTRIEKLANSLYNRFTGNFLFETESAYGKKNKELEARRIKEQGKIEKEIEKLTKEIEEIKNNRIYENSFEWRFEFPEVLNDEGDFTGFDIVMGNPPYIRQEHLGNLKNYLQNNYTVFSGMGDLFSYFYELSFKILSKNGHFCFINNTFDKTNAGKTLRGFIQNNYSILKYVDLTSVVVFDEATTYPVVMLIRKETPHNHEIDFLKMDPAEYANKGSLLKTQGFTKISQHSLDINAWNFGSQNESHLLKKISAHKSLYDKFGKCYRGIITGLNEAFVIENKLSEIYQLKSVFDGKDMKKWRTPAANKWMIVFESKSTKNAFGKLDENEAKMKMELTYPEIFNYLSEYKEKAKMRFDKGEYWWELRNCAYYELFELPKIIFPNLQNSNKFAFDETGTYINAPAVFLPTDDKSLLAILNSKLIWFFLKAVCVVRNGGFIEVKPQYFEKIPVPEISDQIQSVLTDKVNQILSAIKTDPAADISAMEKETEQIVYKLYELTKEEILIVEKI
ncbi:MAG: Eco57I restriction-modification methylase domain-containing protein [Bacteroidia bacterium]|nr:Eco57I restriction-modification methylase domain-containing protein [Bacteroidia bacterium]